jgi:hypothetical protein
MLYNYEKAQGSGAQTIDNCLLQLQLNNMSASLALAGVSDVVDSEQSVDFGATLADTANMHRANACKIGIVGSNSMHYSEQLVAFDSLGMSE